MHAPVGHRQGEGDIGRHRHKGHNGETRLVLTEQNHRHKGELGGGWNNVEHQIVQYRTQRIGAALQIAGDAAGLAVEVIRQRQRKQMAEHAFGNGAHGVITHSRKHRIAQLVEQAAGQAQGAVGQQQPKRQHQRLPGRQLARIQRIDNLFQHQRHAHNRHFGQHQTEQRNHHPALEFPDIGKQAFQVLQILAVGMRRFCGTWNHGGGLYLFWLLDLPQWTRGRLKPTQRREDAKGARFSTAQRRFFTFILICGTAIVSKSSLAGIAASLSLLAMTEYKKRRHCELSEAVVLHGCSVYEPKDGISRHEPCSMIFLPAVETTRQPANKTSRPLRLCGETTILRVLCVLCGKSKQAKHDIITPCLLARLFL